MRWSRDSSAGLFLLGLGAVACWRGADLPLGTLRQIGPGLVPRSLAVLVGLSGLVLCGRSFLASAETQSADVASLEPPLPTPAAGASRRVAVRAPVCLLAAALAFGLAVRPLGLVVASPLAILFATAASPEPNWRESLLFAAGMTICCVLLFRRLLALPLPVAPWLIGY